MSRLEVSKGSRQKVRRRVRGGAIGAALVCVIAWGCGSSPTQSTEDDDATGGEGGSVGETGGASASGGTGGQSGEGGSGGSSTGGAAGSGGEGAGGFGGDTSCDADVVPVTLAPRPLDLIVVVDNSGSMDFEAAQVQSNLTNLVAALSGAGLDPHIVLISATSADSEGVCVPAPLGSGSCPGDQNLPTFRHVEQTVGSTDALEVTVSSYDAWQPSLRTDARRSFLFVSDDDSAVSAETFLTQLTALDPPIVEPLVHAITGSQAGSTCGVCSLSCGTCTNPCCAAGTCDPLSSERGEVYETLQQASGGYYGDLCGQEFEPYFDGLVATEIAASEPSCSFALPAAPVGVDVASETNVGMQLAPGAGFTILPRVAEAETCGASAGWFLQAAEIELCPLACEALRAADEPSVQVEFGCPTQD